MADSPPGSNRLLDRDDPSPVVVVNPGGSSDLLLVGDHAGRAFPRRLGDLGLPPGAMAQHIAWDIGVAGLGGLLAEALDAVFIRQVYSRLVIDCNRRPGEASGTPVVSDGVAVPGNVGLTALDLAQRQGEIYAPYQDCIVRELEVRRERGQRTLLVALHSFTPVMDGFARPWRFGVLHRGDSSLSRRVLGLLRQALGKAVGDNQPYAMDGTDNTIPLHVDGRGLDYVELEVRQDLIGDEAGQREVAGFIGPLLKEAAR